MNQLATKNQFEKLPDNIQVSNKLRELYNANKGITIRKAEDKNVVVKQIHVFINMTILDKGVNLEKDEINYIKTRVVDDIMRDFSNLTVDDVRLAFYYGLRGEFGEYFGINPITFYNWLKSYKNELIPSVYKEIIPLLPSPKKEENIVDRKTLDLQLADNLKEAFENLVNLGHFELFDIGNIHFNLLKRMDLIKLSDSEIAECKNLAMGKVKLNLSEQNVSYAKQGKQFHKLNLNEVYSQIESGENPSYNALVNAEMMRYALLKVVENYKVEKLNLHKILLNKIQSFDYEQLKH